MKRTQRFLVAGGLAGVLALATGSVFAFGKGCGGPEQMAGLDGPGGFGPVAAAYRLDDLSADQRKQLDQLHEKMREEMRKQQALMREERQALREAMKTGDAAKVRPLAEKQGKGMADAMVRYAELHAQVMKILTPEQRETIAKRFDERGLGRGHRHGPPMGW